MLGIVIGVGAVICTVAIGQGGSQKVQEQIQNMGENIVFVAAGSVNIRPECPNGQQRNKNNNRFRCTSDRAANSHGSACFTRSWSLRSGDQRQPELVHPCERGFARVFSNPAVAHRTRKRTSRNAMLTWRPTSVCSEERLPFNCSGAMFPLAKRFD